MLKDADLAWNLFVELRKEIVETQKIRSQVIGFKITFTSTAIGVIIAGSGKWPLQLLALPAFSAVFFDTLIASYGVGIKRMGQYCHQHLEPILRRSIALPEGFLLWHEFRRTSDWKSFGYLGNVGITFLLALPAIVVLGSPPRSLWSLSLLGLLVLALVYDYWIMRLPSRSRELDRRSDGRAT